MSVPHLGPDSHLGKSSSRNSSQDVKSWQTASSYHLGRIFIVVDCQHVILGCNFTRSISNSQTGNGIFQCSRFCWCCCILPIGLTVPLSRPRNKISNPPHSGLGPGPHSYSVLSDTVSSRANLGERQEQGQHSHQSHCWGFYW